MKETWTTKAREAIAEWWPGGWSLKKKKDPDAELEEAVEALEAVPVPEVETPDEEAAPDEEATPEEEPPTADLEISVSAGPLLNRARRRKIAQKKVLDKRS